jgi:hypothetical protein
VRWNGTAWKRVPSPGPAGGDYLLGVAATSARNAWAVGFTGTNKALILRWNGAAWKQARSPNPEDDNNGLLFGVAATSAGNAWAVGDTLSGGARMRTLIVHWNGTGWK